MEKLKAKLHLVGCKAENQHIVFVDDPAQAEKFDEADYFETPKELLDRTFNRPRRQQMKTQVMLPADDMDQNKLQNVDE